MNDQRRLMRIAYLDCFSGISGDMFLGALIDAGIPLETFERTVQALGVGAKLKISRVNRSGISATKVNVLVSAETDTDNTQMDHEHVRPDQTKPGISEHGESKEMPEPHGHSHSHEHHHAHEHSAHLEHTHEHATHHHAHEHGRGLKEIRGIIAAATITESAKKTAIAIFEKLGAAEAKIHNVPIEKIHFHEVGAVDALVDIVCAAVGVGALGADEFVCSPLNVGGGTIECAHGTFPVPAPATVELLKGSPIYSSGIQAELVTPTGAAIVATLINRFGPFPLMKVEKSGYGAGTRDPHSYPNVLRIAIGEVTADADKSVRATQFETVSILEANLDDLNPQVFGYVMDRLFEAGALDVFCMPAQMKKNRPGMLLTVLAKPEDTEKLTQIVFAETTTLGIRQHEEQRRVLARKWQTVTTQFGDVRIKIGSMNGSVSNYAPEYEDCRRIATEQKVPLKSVIAEAMEAYARSLKGKASSV